MKTQKQKKNSAARRQGSGTGKKKKWIQYLKTTNMLFEYDFISILKIKIHKQ